MVTVFISGMNRSPDAAEWRCDWPEIELTRIQYLDRLGRKEPIRGCNDAHNLKRTRSEMSSQWSWRQMVSDT